MIEWRVLNEGSVWDSIFIVLSVKFVFMDSSYRLTFMDNSAFLGGQTVVIRLITCFVCSTVDFFLSLFCKFCTAVKYLSFEALIIQYLV